MLEAEGPLQCRGTCRIAAPGCGFFAKVDDRWLQYKPEVDELLGQAYCGGLQKVIFSVRGIMYKFDLEHMQQTNLGTLDAAEMRAPHNLPRPVVAQRCCSWDKVKSAFSHRSVYVVRVPRGSPGTIIEVPHPKKLGKAMRVGVPKDAHVGQALFLPVPRKRINRAMACGAGATVGAGAVVLGVTLSSEAGGAVAAAGGAVATGVAAVGPAAPFIIGGVAIAGALAVSAATVHYATRYPTKAAAVGALAIGGLALSDHVAEVGVAEAAGDLAEFGGDLAEDAHGAAAGVFDGADRFAEEVQPWLDAAASDVGDFIADASLDFVADLF